MNLSCGLVGLPNVGKSTIFNAILKKAAAAAENYPFCTIEPNVGSVPVKDFRLNALSEISGSKKIIPALLKCVDIAGLVRNAGKGEGLGNKFLGHIRECDLIIQVLRCFDDPDITHVEGEVNPVRDYDIINLELQFSDLDKLEKILQQKKLSPEMKKMAQIAQEYLSSNYFLNTKDWNLDFLKFFKEQGLLTYKPILIVANMPSDKDNKYYDQIKHLNPIKVYANIEVLLEEVEENEEQEFLQSFGINESGLSTLIKTAYEKLGLISFFTTGKEETRAWKVKNTSTMQEAAGVIHTDFAKHFISADVIEYDDFIKYQGWTLAKESGVVKKTAKETLVKDGDVCLFKSYK